MNELLKPVQLLRLSFILSLLALLLINNILIGVGILVVILFIISNSRLFLIGFLLIALLTLSSYLGTGIRLIVQILSIGTISFYFIKDYGFDFKFYRTIPRPVIYFLLLLLLSFLTSIGFSSYQFAGIVFFFRTTVFLLIIYMIYSLIKTEKDLYAFVMILVISGLMLVIGVVADFATSGFNLLSFFTGNFSRFSGLISSVNATGGLISNLIPLIIAFMFYSKFNAQKKSILLLLLIILCIGLLLTSSRSAYLSTFLSFLIVIYTLKKELIKLLLIPFIIILCGLLFYEPLGNFFQILVRAESGLSGREIFWDLSFNIVKDNFLFGIGPGAYKYEVYNYMPVLLESFSGNTIKELMEITGGTNSSHNFYLLFFSDMGILGLLTSIMIPVIFYRISIPVLKYFKNRDERNYLLSLSIIALGTGLFIRSFFMEVGLLNYGFITSDLQFWIFFSMIIYFYNDIFVIKKVHV